MSQRIEVSADCRVGPAKPSFEAFRTVRTAIMTSDGRTLPITIKRRTMTVSL